MLKLIVTLCSPTLPIAAQPGGAYLSEPGGPPAGNERLCKSCGAVH